jgi:hypothetical protein
MRFITFECFNSRSNWKRKLFTTFLACDISAIGTESDNVQTCKGILTALSLISMRYSLQFITYPC